MLRQHTFKFSEIITELKTILKSVPANIATVDRQSWLLVLENSCATLVNLLKTDDVERLMNIRDRIEPLLDTVPAQINERIKATASDLGIERIQATLLNVQKQLDPQQETELKSINAKLNSVYQLAQRLDNLVTIHDRFQEMDWRFSFLQGTLATNDLENFVRYWNLWNGSLQMILNSGDPLWIELVEPLIASIDANLKQPELAVLRGEFDELQGQMNMYFFKMDKQLKEACSNMREVGDSLDELLGMLMV